MINRLCVYCGSSMGKNDVYREAAHQLGGVLARRDIGLVYGGASIGLMGTIADTVLSNGGDVFGVIPKSILDFEVAHANLTELHVVADMHERKAKMTELADGFIALPGGLGTLEELFEALTWLQLGFHSKPCAVLNVNGYYDQLLSFLQHIGESGFAKPSHLNNLIVASEADELIDRMLAFQAPSDAKLG